MKTAINIFVVLLFWSGYVNLVDGTPERDNCDDVPSGAVIRMRDLSDCNKFYYCHEGLQKPYQGSCPFDEAAGIHLYFNPETTNCDLAQNVPQSCLESSGSDSDDAGEVITASNPEPVPEDEESPVTPEKPVRPPKLDDKNGLIIDCSEKGCGLFPNTYGACDTYVACINGEKVEKKCHGGQLFDVETKECQPAEIAKCWTEPNAGPHAVPRKHADCPFHNYEPTTPIETRADGVVLRNPIVTNDGSWQSWVECPAGRYATGLYAWRRMLRQQGNVLVDHVGIISVSLLCQTPGGNEQDTQIESLAPNSPRDGWPLHYMCRGGIVGFRMNSAGPEGWRGDKIAADNVQGMCSCSGPVFKPYDELKYAPQNGHRGTWTEPQYCKKYQAVCGMQTQMQEYKGNMLGKYDNSGLHNMKVKCCDVPDPLDVCETVEERQFVRTCDNLNNEEYLRCDFESVVGHSMDMSNTKLIDFYSSIGYTFQDSKDNITTHIQDKLKEKIEAGTKLDYTWDDVVEPAVEGDETITPQKLYIRPNEKHDLYQVVGKCGYFLIRTNRYVRVITDSSGATREEMFEV